MRPPGMLTKPADVQQDELTKVDLAHPYGIDPYGPRSVAAENWEEIHQEYLHRTSEDLSRPPRETLKGIRLPDEAREHGVPDRLETTVKACRIDDTNCEACQ